MDTKQTQDLKIEMSKRFSISINVYCIYKHLKITFQLHNATIECAYAECKDFKTHAMADACMCEPRMLDKDSNPRLPGRTVGHQYIWQISWRPSNKTRS